MDTHSYRKDLPPYKRGYTVDINVTIFLLNVNKIALPSTFDAKFEVQLNWTDYRLDYIDLHEKNQIDENTKQKLWIPPLRFSNTENNKILDIDKQTTMRVIRKGDFVLNDQNELHEAAIFSGDENFLYYKRGYHTIFECDYDLRLYPFDEQICHIDIEIPKFIQRYINVYPGETGNHGIKELAQFIITETTIESIRNNSLVRCKIHLKRMPLYHIATTYVPTLSIIFMALFTLFIDQSHFEATIMVALTAMLVMYTLFQSIAGSMPSTAYLKLLDIWLIFGLFMPFLVFTIEVAWELMDQNQNKYKKNSITSNKRYYGKRPSDKSVLRKARCILPTITIGFIVCYIVVVLCVH